MQENQKTALGEKPAKKPVSDFSTPYEAKQLLIEKEGKNIPFTKAEVESMPYGFTVTGSRYGFKGLRSFNHQSSRFISRNRYNQPRVERDELIQDQNAVPVPESVTNQPELVTPIDEPLTKRRGAQVEVVTSQSGAKILRDAMDKFNSDEGEE